MENVWDVAAHVINIQVTDQNSDGNETESQGYVNYIETSGNTHMLTAHIRESSDIHDLT